MADEEDFSPPPPCHAGGTGTFDAVPSLSASTGDIVCFRPKAAGATGEFRDIPLLHVDDQKTLEMSVEGSPVASPKASFYKRESSFQWNTGKSFRLYASRSTHNLTRLGSIMDTVHIPFVSAQHESPDTSPKTTTIPHPSGYSALAVLQEFIVRNGKSISSTNLAESNIKKGPCIGKGGYAEVFAGFNSDSKELVGIKEIKVGEDATRAQFLAIEDEFRILRRLKHPNVVRYWLFEHSRTQKIARIIMEFVSGGSMLDMYKNVKSFSEEMVRYFAKQIFQGLAFIHKEGILHRDIKPANILINATGHIKLADFGCSRNITEMGGQTQHLIGTPIYMAPEFIRGNFEKKSDVWAVGCTLLELFSGMAPWCHTGVADHLTLMFHIATSLDTPRIPDECSPAMQSLLELCFQRDVSRRPSAEECLQHEWFKGDVEDAGAVQEIREVAEKHCDDLVSALTREPAPETSLSESTVMTEEDAGPIIAHPQCLMVSENRITTASPHEHADAVLADESVDHPVVVSVTLPSGGDSIELEFQPDDVSVQRTDRSRSVVLKMSDNVKKRMQAKMDDICALSESQMNGSNNSKDSTPRTGSRKGFSPKPLVLREGSSSPPPAPLPPC